MLALGFSLDNLSLMAMTIAVGFVVDDAIVMVEVIWQRIEHGEKPFEAALAGAGEIAFTILTISISLIAVFTPLMFMGGVVGRLMQRVRPDAQRRGAGLDRPVADADADAGGPVPAAAEAGRQRRSSAALERGFARLESSYARALDVVLRHMRLTLGGLPRDGGAGGRPLRRPCRPASSRSRTPASSRASC